MTGAAAPRDFDSALQALLDDLGDLHSRSEATLQLMLMLETANAGSDTTGYEWVSAPLRDRYLTREETERVIGRIHDEMREAGRRPNEQPGLGDLASALGRAPSDLALPPLLEALAGNWERANAGDIRAVLSSLERQLRGSHYAPSALEVEQVRAHPRLRETLRQAVSRHLDTPTELSEDLTRIAETVDGYIAVVLSEPELRPVRRWTFAIRHGIGGTWPEVVRAMVQAAYQPIDRCVMAYETDERGHVSVLVLAPNESIYHLEVDLDEESTLTRALWTTLDEQRRAQHAHAIDLLQRVSELEQHERAQLGRVPQSTHTTPSRTT